MPEAFRLLLEPKRGLHRFCISKLLRFFVYHGEIVAQEVLIPIKLPRNKTVPRLLQLNLQLPCVVAVRILYQLEEHPRHRLLFVALVREHLHLIV